MAGAHGLGGELRLKSFSDDLSPYPRLWAGDRALTVKAVRAGGQGTILRTAEITDRDAAEALRGTLLSVPRDALPPLAEGEYYHADLIGLPCRLPDGSAVGRVAAVENYGAGDIVEIARADGTLVMVPFREPAARRDGDGIVVEPAFLA